MIALQQKSGMMPYAQGHHTQTWRESRSHCSWLELLTRLCAPNRSLSAVAQVVDEDVVADDFVEVASGRIVVVVVVLLTSRSHRAVQLSSWLSAPAVPSPLAADAISRPAVRIDFVRFQLDESLKS